MYISPCGWFCILIPEQWRTVERRDGVLLISADNLASLEITSARQERPLNDHEITEIHEAFLRTERIRPDETRIFQTEQNLDCTLSATTNGLKLVVIAHLGWSHYALFFHMECTLDEDLEERLEGLQFILDHLEPLTVD